MPELAGRPRLPQVGRLLERPEVAAFIPRLSRPLVLRAARAAVERARAEALAGGASPPSEEALAEEIAGECRLLARRRLGKVLNGAGVLLHTNLGRSPIDPGDWDAARAANTGYSNLEYELEGGSRGKRGGLAPELAALLSGAESALVVNNNAAAVLLLLSALASGREVVVSRGEQVQIGGGFRIPDILALSGARLVEVGTTNVTTVEDYLSAIGPETALVLKVHSSNFAIRGFASSPTVAELAGALPPGLPLVVDQGSGAYRRGLPGEIPASGLLRDGAAVAAFSCDKLLGGPQAGILAGRAAIIQACSRHPLARALRPGKTVLSLLEARLVRALDGADSPAQAPSLAALEAYGRRLLGLLPGGLARLADSLATPGGGSAPDESYPSRAVAFDRRLPAEAFLAELRAGEPPLVALAKEGRVLVDLACLVGEDIGLVAASLNAAIERLGPGGGAARARAEGE